VVLNTTSMKAWRTGSFLNINVQTRNKLYVACVQEPGETLCSFLKHFSRPTSDLRFGSETKTMPSAGTRSIKVSTQITISQQVCCNMLDATARIGPLLSK
jgi:hypothetical protein